MSWYNRDREQEDVLALSAHGKVTNPNSEFFKNEVKLYQRTGRPVMQLFADFIRENADVVAFRRFDDGMLGAGVAREVFEAFVWSKPVWQVGTLYTGEVYVAKSLVTALSPDNVLTVEQTKARSRRSQM
jgi:hypothetical protein